MIASRTGLTILAANAAAAVLLVALDRPGAPPDTRLVPFAPHAIDGPGFSLILADGKLAWRSPPGEVDPTTGDALLTALRAARWHRRARLDAGAPYTAELALDRTRVRRGRAVEGAAQGWLAIDDAAYLVDRWVIDALFPAPLALRIAHPLDVVAPTWTLGAHVFDGEALDGVRLTDAARAQLRDALDALALTGVPAATAAPLAVFTVTHGDRTMSLTDQPCGSGAYARASTGDGCTDPAPWRALIALVAQPPAIDPRPLDGGADRATLIDGGELSLTRIPAGVDPARVDEFRRALATPGTLVTTTSRELGELRVGGTTFTLYADGAIRRGHEPVRIVPALPHVLDRRIAAFGDPHLWREEPTTIHAIELDGATYTRGAVIGEWDHGNAAALEQLAAALAAPAVAAGGSAHHLAVVVERPDGTRDRHALALDARCNGDAALCALLSRASG